MTVTQPEWVEALKRPAAYLLKSTEKIKFLEIKKELNKKGHRLRQ